MDCNRVKDLLYAYIDNELEPALREGVTEHLSRCEGCREELTSMKRYTEVMVSLERKKAPEDFLESVHQHLDQKSLMQRVIEKLFLPIRIKIPLEAAGVVASAVIIILLLNPFESVKDAEYPVERKREERLAVRESPEKTRSPAISEKPAPPPAKELGMITRAKLKKRTKAPEGTEAYTITLLIKPDLLLRDATVVSEEKKLPSIAGEKRRGEELDESLEKEDFTQKKSRKSIAEERKDSPSEPLIETMNRIKRLTASLEGRVIKEEYNKKTNLPEAVILEIPTRNYRAFMGKLNQLGSIQKRRTSIPLRRNKAATLRIDLDQ